MVKFSYIGINKIEEKLDDTEFKNSFKNSKNHFIRNRKMNFKDIICYIINKKGLCTNMEINNYFDKVNVDKTMSAQSLLEQRKKLNPAAFFELNKEYIETFYNEFSNEVKTYNGYLLKAIDGSDIEVPNSKKSKENYGYINGDSEKGIPRASASCVYDVLNRYITTSTINPYRTSEMEMSRVQMQEDCNLSNKYKSIYIMDRGYVCIETMVFCILTNKKFIIRLDSKAYTKERSQITTEDEYIDLKYTKERTKKRYFRDENLRQYARSLKSSNLRIVTHILNTGEIEQLITNLTKEEMNYKDIIYLYSLRWGIETTYYSLKEKLELERFTSSNKIIIEQDFYSSILVFNMISSMKKEAEEKIEQKKYKHEMKVNDSMAIGLFKNDFIFILLEEDDNKKKEMYNKLINKISKYRIPIRKDRKFPIIFKAENKHSFNKLKNY